MLYVNGQVNFAQSKLVNLIYASSLNRAHEISWRKIFVFCWANGNLSPIAVTSTWNQSDRGDSTSNRFFWRFWNTRIKIERNNKPDSLKSSARVTPLHLNWEVKYLKVNYLVPEQLHKPSRTPAYSPYPIQKTHQSEDSRAYAFPRTNRLNWNIQLSCTCP